jgi:hypothetical protein
MNLLLSPLGLAERRWYAAVEANRLNQSHDGIYMIAQVAHGTPGSASGAPAGFTLALV